MAKIILAILTAWVILLKLLNGAIEPGCENCGCCVDKECGTAYVQGGYRDEYCTKGCIPGIGGNKCYHKCPDDCVTCEQTLSKNCATCSDGKYLTSVDVQNDPNYSFRNACVDCPDKCTACTSATSCQSCAPGYYGTSCSSTCPSRCKTCTSTTQCQECNQPYYNEGSVTDCSLSCPGNCECSTPGVCSRCKEGFFDISSECASACPDNCKTCTDQSACQSCKDGFYNGKEYDNPNAIGMIDCTLTCRDKCSRCSAYDSCTECKQGFYGTYCQNNCSVGCMNNVCSITDGSCSCRSNFTGSLCTECIPGKYGYQCDQRCPVDCKDSICGRWNGFCVECKSANITGNKCDQCKPGTWGSLCSSICPRNCAEENCTRSNGHCTSCKGHFIGETCELCVNGYYGFECSQECPSNCKDSVCFKSDGTCQACKGNFTGTRCEECTPGWYGFNCDTQCPSSNCANNTCHKNTGDCISCAPGHYGQRCDQICSNGCQGNVCDVNSGACSACQPSYTGDKCCLQGGNCSICSSNDVCDKCGKGYFGLGCNLLCPTNCPDITEEAQCDKVSGACASCPDGLHGVFCNTTCGKNCLNNRCRQDNGHCTEGCAGNFEGSLCAQAVKDPGGPGAGPIAGGVGGVVAVIAAVAVVFFIIIRRRRADASKGDLDTTTSLPRTEFSPADVTENQTPTNANLESVVTTGNMSANVENDLLEVEDEEDILTNGVENPDAVYVNVVQVSVAELEAYVKKKTKDELAHEFSQLPKGLTREYTDARKPGNVVKNRYNGIYPYDHSRVRIKGDRDFFINASFIDGYQKPNAYIACLGPTAKAMSKFGTFWKMVWRMDADIIVMLTNLTEPSGNKCEKYWPRLGTTKTFGDYKVEGSREEIFTEYTVRTFTIEHKSKKRTVYQLHYTVWPDKSVPDEITSLTEFRQRVRRTPRVFNGPIIVHCSAGIGRTGTYIALDRLTEAGEGGEKINIFDVVYQMRQQRVNMVQTLGQYEFLHKALVHTLVYDSPALTAGELNAYLQKDDREWNNNFQTLEKSMDEDALEEIEARNKNKEMKEMNRKKSDIPGDRNRPRLFVGRSFDSSNYINAVYVDGFRKHSQYIIAQSPLMSKVFDFLCLVFQEDCSCIVSLEDETLIGTEIGDYRGADNMELTCGTFTVKSVKCDSNQAFVMRKLVISNSGMNFSGEKIVHHYQIANWKHKERVPNDAGDFGQFVKTVVAKAEETGVEKAPILVHCLTGAKRSGLFCAVGLSMERLAIEGRVSVPSVIRQLRCRRKTAIPNKEQYKFCYRSLAALPVPDTDGHTYYDFSFRS